MKYRTGSTVLNADQIISVIYQKVGVVYITTTAVEADVQYAYEDVVSGVGSKSVVIILRGDEADRFWDAYSSDALEV